jgi:hypothetical protein
MANNNDQFQPESELRFFPFSNWMQYDPRYSQPYYEQQFYYGNNFQPNRSRFLHSSKPFKPQSNTKSQNKNQTTLENFSGVDIMTQLEMLGDELAEQQLENERIQRAKEKRDRLPAVIKP